MITEALHKIANHRTSLSRDEARSVMDEVLNGKATDAQIAALLVSLHMKGETVEEIVGFAEAIRFAATPFNTGQPLQDGGLDVGDLRFQSGEVGHGACSSWPPGYSSRRRRVRRTKASSSSLLGMCGR